MFSCDFAVMLNGFWPMKFAIFERSFDMETNFNFSFHFGHFKWHNFPYVRHKQFT